MKVFNLTDVETAVLKQRGLVLQHFATSGRMIEPGEFADVEDTAKARADLSYLLSVGAVAIDKLPPPYVQKRQQLAAEGGKLRPIPGEFLDVKETKTAGEPPPNPQGVEGVQEVLTRNDPTVGADVPADEPVPPPPEASAKSSKNRR